MDKRDEAIRDLANILAKAAELEPVWEALWGKYIDALNTENAEEIARAEFALIKFDEAQGFPPLKCLTTIN